MLAKNASSSSSSCAGTGLRQQRVDTAGAGIVRGVPACAGVMPQESRGVGMMTAGTFKCAGVAGNAPSAQGSGHAGSAGCYDSQLPRKRDSCTGRDL